MRRILLAGLAAAGALTGCSSSHPAAGPAPATSQPSLVQTVPCSAALRTAFSKAASGTVTAQSDVAVAFTTCSYRATATTSGACTAATVTINTNPQPYKDFQRWVVETAQNDTTARLGDGYFPHEIDGVGVEAGWVPATQNLQTANNERWVSVKVTCPTSGGRDLAVAKGLATVALAPSNP